MEPIILSGAVILVFGLWVEYKAILMKAAKTVSGKIVSPPMQVQKPLYVNYMTGIGT